MRLVRAVTCNSRRKARRVGPSQATHLTARRADALWRGGAGATGAGVALEQDLTRARPPAAMRPRRASRRSPWPSCFVAFAAFVAARGAAASADDDGSTPSPSRWPRGTRSPRARTRTRTPRSRCRTRTTTSTGSSRAPRRRWCTTCCCSGARRCLADSRTREGGMFSAGGGGQPRGACAPGRTPSRSSSAGGKTRPTSTCRMASGSTSAATPRFRTLVLEVHYLEKFAGAADADATSGVTVHLKPGVPTRFMSVLAYAQGFSLPPRERRTEVKTVCSYVDSAPLDAQRLPRAHARARDGGVSGKSRRRPGVREGEDTRARRRKNG